MRQIELGNSSKEKKKIEREVGIIVPRLAKRTECRGERGSGEATSVSSRVVLLNWKVAAGFGRPPPAPARRCHYLLLTELFASLELRVTGAPSPPKKYRLATEAVSRQLGAGCSSSLLGMELKLQYSTTALSAFSIATAPHLAEEERFN